MLACRCIFNVKLLFPQNNCFWLLHVGHSFAFIHMKNEEVYKGICKMANKRVRNGTCSASNVKNLVYAIALIFLTALCLERGSQSLRQYLEKSTFFETVLVPQYHAEFPTFSICPLYNGYKEDVLKVR